MTQIQDPALRRETTLFHSSAITSSVKGNTAMMSQHEPQTGGRAAIKIFFT